MKAHFDSNPASARRHSHARVIPFVYREVAREPVGYPARGFDSNPRGCHPFIYAHTPNASAPAYTNLVALARHRGTVVPFDYPHAAKTALSQDLSRFDDEEYRMTG